MKTKFIFMACLILAVVSVIIIIRPREDTGYYSHINTVSKTVYWDGGLFATLSFELDYSLQIINPRFGDINIVYADTRFTGFALADDWFKLTGNEIEISIYGIITDFDYDGDPNDIPREFHRLTTNFMLFQ